MWEQSRKKILYFWIQLREPRTKCGINDCGWLRLANNNATKGRNWFIIIQSISKKTKKGRRLSKKFWIHFIQTDFQPHWHTLIVCPSICNHLQNEKLCCLILRFHLLASLLFEFANYLAVFFSLSIRLLCLPTTNNIVQIYNFIEPFSVSNSFY